MFSKSNITIFIIFAICVIGLFQIKYRVLELKRDTKEMSQNLDREKRELSALKAEWAYLNNPTRIASLAAKYLKLSKTTVDRLGEMQAPSKVDKIEIDNRKAKIMSIAYKKSGGKWRYRQDVHKVTKESNNIGKK